MTKEWTWGKWDFYFNISTRHIAMPLAVGFDNLRLPDEWRWRQFYVHFLCFSIVCSTNFE